MKLLRILSVSILLLALLSVFAGINVHLARGGNVLGKVGVLILKFAEFPLVTWQVLQSDEIKGLPPTYLKADSDSAPNINLLKSDLFALGSFWNEQKSHWIVALMNLRNNDTIHNWVVVKEADEGFTVTQFPNSRLMNPLLLPDRDIIIFHGETPSLKRLNKDSEVLWHNSDKSFHHSLNPDHEGNLWICSSDKPTVASSVSIGTRVQNFNGKSMFFMEDYLTLVDANNGKILYDKGITDILMENGLVSIALGTSAPSYWLHDLMHLNDIEPVLEDGPYWKKGDVFFSLRHKSMVFHFRPATNKIIRIIQGPFLNQHDVDIVNDSTLTLFNNNWVSDDRIKWATDDELESTKGIKSYTFPHSQIIQFNFADSTFDTILEESFKREVIQTKTEGLHQRLADGSTFVEEQNSGQLFIFKDNSTIYHNSFLTPVDGYIHLPNWFRIYEQIDF